MTMSSNNLIDQLRKAGIPVADTGPADRESPWYVKALQGFSGWFASFFVLGFLALALQPVVEGAFGAFIIGLTALAGAFAILRVARNEFLEHLGLSISLAGQLLVAFSAAQTWDFDVVGPFWWIMAGLQLALAIVMPNFMHRVVSMGFACMSFSAALFSIGLFFVPGSLVLLATVSLWLNEFRLPQRIHELHALGYGLALGLVAITLLARLGWLSDFGLQAAHFWSAWLGEALALMALLYLIVSVLKRRLFEPRQFMIRLVFFSAAVIGVLSLQVTGLVQGTTLLLLAFAVGNRLLAGLGVATLLYAVSSYYYWLDITLLEKSGTLLALGLVLLAVRWFVIRRPNNRGQHNA